MKLASIAPHLTFTSGKTSQNRQQLLKTAPHAKVARPQMRRPVSGSVCLFRLPLAGRRSGVSAVRTRSSSSFPVWENWRLLRRRRRSGPSLWMDAFQLQRVRLSRRRHAGLFLAKLQASEREKCCLLPCGGKWVRWRCSERGRTTTGPSPARRIKRTQHRDAPLAFEFVPSSALPKSPCSSWLPCSSHLSGANGGGAAPRLSRRGRRRHRAVALSGRAPCHRRKEEEEEKRGGKPRREG